MRIARMEEVMKRGEEGERGKTVELCFIPSLNFGGIDGSDFPFLRFGI
jgi:hypothetical protein